MIACLSSREEEIVRLTACFPDVYRTDASLLSCALTSACTTSETITVPVRRSTLSGILEAAAATNDSSVREVQERSRACFGHTGSSATFKLQACPECHLTMQCDKGV